MKCFNCSATDALLQYVDTYICESCYTLLGNNKCGSSTRLHDQYLKSKVKPMIICIDGNDGTGKTTLIESLKKQFPYHTFLDRGIPTFMVMQELNKKEEYKNDPVFISELKLAAKFFETTADLTVVLSCSPEKSLGRLVGKNSESYWHQLQRIVDTYEQYQIVSNQHRWYLIDSQQCFDKVFGEVVELIISEEK